MRKLFEKGDARINRKGRPKKGMALTDIINIQLDRKDTDGRLRRVAIAEKLIELAAAGDVAALRYLIDRVDGRPKESVKISGDVLETKLQEILR